MNSNERQEYVRRYANEPLYKARAALACGACLVVLTLVAAIVIGTDAEDGVALTASSSCSDTRAQTEHPNHPSCEMRAAAR